MPEIPTNTTTPTDTEFVTYTGAWDKEIAEVSGAATYTWVITESKIMVTVTFNGVAMETPKGETVTAPSIKEAGKVLTGWTVNGETVDFDTYIVMDAVDFVPVWTAIPYATSGDTYMNAVEWDEGTNWYYEIGSQAEVKEWDVNLPVMAYPEGKTVTYNWIGGAWILVGIGGNYVQGQGVGSQGTISITNVGGTLVVTVENTANPASITAKYTDTDIVAGNKPLTIKVDNGAQYNHFFISKEPTVTDSVIQTNIFDKTAIYNSAGTAFVPATTSDTGATYTVGADYGTGTITLPKIDFTKYTKVTFNWATSGWIQFGWDVHLWYYDYGTALNGTATITYRDGKVWMSFECNGLVAPSDWTLSFSSEDIHTGKEAITLGYNNMSTWMSQSITISNFTLGELPPVATYTVKFVDSTGDVLSEQTVEEGKMPEIPTNVTTPENTDTMTYTGAWDKEVVAVTGDVTYTWVVTGTEVVKSVFEGAMTIYADGTTAGATLEANKATFVVKNGVDASVALPCIDYTKYNVTFNWAESNGYVVFGYNGDWYFNAGPAYYGTATLTYANGALTLVMNSPMEGGGERTYTIENADIINGTAPLTFTYLGWADGSIVFSDMVMTEIVPEVTSVFAGAMTIYADGTTAGATLEANKATFVVKNGVDASVALPCIDYTKYNVTFNWAESNGYVVFGYNGDWYFNAGPAYYGTATLTYANGALTLVMNSPMEGGGERTYTIENADIINGTAPLTFTYLGWADGSIVFSDMVMTEVEVPAEPAAPTFTFEGTGVFDGSGNMLTAANVTETGATYDAPDNVDVYVAIPKIDFTKVSKVTFDWQDGGWTKLGSATTYYSENKADPSVSGSVEIVNNGDGTLILTFNYGAKTKTETITDADVINGTKAYTLKIKDYGYKILTISNFTVVA